jgi:hypothetical protein
MMAMKSYRLILTSFASLSCGLLLTGCARTDYGVGSPYQPGPVAGKTVGSAVGVTAGNVAGFGVGAVSGAAHGFAAPFDPSYHMVRYWRTETTSDGRTIQVPYDILVDQYGRPVKMPAPTGNPKPPTPVAQPPPTAPVAPVAQPPPAPPVESAPPPASPAGATNGAPQ